MNSDKTEAGGAERSGTRTGAGSTAAGDDGQLPENSQENLDEKLDNAVDETFPGSDPVSVRITK